MINKDQGTGIAERILYGAILAIAMRLVDKGIISADMATYIAAGGVSLAGAAWAWWINRPTALLNAAAATVPDNAVLAITTTPGASHAERVAAHQLANAASDKVVAKTPAA